MQTPGVSRQDLSLLKSIIDAFDEDVFQSQFLFFARIPVVQGRKKLGHWPFAVDGHDLLADFVSGAMQ